MSVKKWQISGMKYDCILYSFSICICIVMKTYLYFFCECICECICVTCSESNYPALCPRCGQDFRHFKTKKNYNPDFISFVSQNNLQFSRPKRCLKRQSWNYHCCQTDLFAISRPQDALNCNPDSISAISIIYNLQDQTDSSNYQTILIPTLSQTVN